MRTREETKLIRTFKLIIMWILFIAVTVSGIFFADSRTEYIRSGKEAETVKIFYEFN